MGKATGFIDYPRVERPNRPVAQRVGDYGELHGELPPAVRREQAGRCMNCGVPFCQAPMGDSGSRRGCPLRNLIPEWNDLAWLSNLPLALARLLKTNCFPEFTGRVCPAPCERACLCREASGAAVTIRDNELAIIEAAYASGLMEPQPPAERSGRTVAVVGSGPAGLACAWWLNRRGHAVTVFERAARPGGLLTYGIPAMKLPQQVVDRRVDLMRAEGVAFACGTEVESLDALLAADAAGAPAASGGEAVPAAGAPAAPGGEAAPATSDAPAFDAVVLCCGAQKPREVPFENADLPGMVYALDYLGCALRAQLGEDGLRLSAAGRHVCIIGNGDTATDCVATALRQGAASIMQVIRKPESHYAPGLDYAHEEALEIYGEIRRFETQVKAARGAAAGDAPAAGAPAGGPGPLASLTLSTPGGEEDVPCDLLIVASGFSGCDDVAASLQEQAATREGVFVAGDMAHGATLVVNALADARAVAARVDRYLTGFSSIG